jgi:hypothetical protein
MPSKIFTGSDPELARKHIIMIANNTGRTILLRVSMKIMKHQKNQTQNVQILGWETTPMSRFEMEIV